MIAPGRRDGVLSGEYQESRLSFGEK